MNKLTKYEKETIINFNEGEQEAIIYTFNADLKRRLADFSKNYPSLCQMTRSIAEGSVTYVIDKSRISIRLCRRIAMSVGRQQELMRKNMVLRQYRKSRKVHRGGFVHAELRVWTCNFTGIFMSVYIFNSVGEKRFARDLWIHTCQHMRTERGQTADCLREP
jgi:hypothetical protein